MVAINAGSDEPYVDKDGITYQADTNFQGGVASTEGRNSDWHLPNVDVYHSERYGLGEDFSYRLPIDMSKDKKYILILKFSEVYFWEPEMKIFDVAIGDKTVLKDFDIFSRAGSKLLPHDEFITLEVKKKELYIEGVKNHGGI